MKTIVPGHRYTVPHFEITTNFHTIQFIHKEPNPKEPTNLVLIDDGTTNEEVLKVLIDRMQFLQSKFPCRENAIVITKLEESLMWLEKRTADRVNRQVEGKHMA